jgi:hypothetical protein
MKTGWRRKGRRSAPEKGGETGRRVVEVVGVAAAEEGKEGMAKFDIPEWADRARKTDE